MKRLDLLMSHMEKVADSIETPLCLLLKLDRYSAMNSVNFSIVHSVISHAHRSVSINKPLVLTGKSTRAFSAGGCLKITTKNVDEVAEYLRSLHEMFYTLTEMPTLSISIWSGYVIGTGAGIACSCKIRVAMPATVYSMPENSIGLYADVGGTYFLTHFVPEHIGLYLCLTGLSMRGADCYKFGLCNFYIEEFEKLIIDIERGMHPYHAIKMHHKEPTVFSDVSRFELSIKECFGGVQSVEEVFQRIDRCSNTKWKEDINKHMAKLCPLSLKVGFKAFRKAQKMDFEECLKMDYILENKMMVRFNYNFQVGATSAVSTKRTPEWIPRTLREVSEEMVEELFRVDGLNLNLRALPI